MTPMDYGPDFVPPWRAGLPQARCAGRLCQGEGMPGKLVVAMTLDDEGLCASCSDTASKQDGRVLRLLP